MILMQITRRTLEYMSKYNEYLTEIVYQIDDLIYDFYRKSNELIATKRNTENLLEFRDNTIDTVNDMNVRALEMIASFKKDVLVEERAEILLERNKDILDSAYKVILKSPSKGELFSEVKDAAKDALNYASDKVNDFQKSDTYANLKDYTEKGYTRLKDAVEKVSQDQRVQDSVQTVKEKTTEALSKGETLVKNWWHDTQTKPEENHQETPFEGVEIRIERAAEAVEEEIKEVTELDHISQLDKEVEQIQEALNDLRSTERDNE